MFDVVELDSARYICPANPVRNFPVNRCHVLLSFLQWKEHAMRPKHVQLYHLSALRSLLSNMGAYLFGGPSLPAVGGLLLGLRDPL